MKLYPILSALSPHHVVESMPNGGLASQLEMILRLVNSRVAAVDRIAVVAHDANTGLLKTLVSTNRDDGALKHYEVALADVPTLSELAVQRGTRVIHNLVDAFRSPSTPNHWLKHHHYPSSVTTPVSQGDVLAGFLFYDSRQLHAFTDADVEELREFTDLIAHLFLTQRRLARGIVSAIQVAVDLARSRDFETGQHLERIAYYSRIMARALAASHSLSDAYIEYVELFSPLHDIGKVGIPDHILLKPGRLDAAEYEIMKRHVAMGESIIGRISQDLGLQGSMQEQIMRNIVSTHHERGDGSGYPRGLTMEHIPLEGRIVAVADVYDALSNRRAYKNSWDDAAVCAELRAEADAGLLDRDCVEALLSAKEERASIKQRFADVREPGDYA
ncbi:HD domain-containing phosphohydrolase [Rhodoferax mekongensis]|uniref:HD domain-containing protein n=1 Tax=Rhodoferax mekongensis TaxID=3068341 RepID=A0ABZ0B1K0_9BURK|nr:HD domain-containing phosphohydrolase [Rhodoferax sp. TBRC 17307]WNO05789.1 HD domain-containing protein [Rhodoferax sp. TBRC 17307]